MVAAISINQWKSLVATCGIGEQVAALERRLGLDFADEAQRYEAREEIAALVEPWFAARTRQQAEAALEANKACWGRYDTATGLLAHDPRVGEANPVFERIATPGVGTHLSAGAAVRVSGLERAPTAPAPLLGTHTDEVLHEVLGLDSGAIGRLHDAGLVAGPQRDPSA
jgi:2-methylfumaryl-CoA isomerase